MKRKMTLYGIISVIAMCLILIAVYRIKNIEANEDVLLKVALYRTGTTYLTYYFIIKQDGVLESLYGERKNDNIKSSKFLKTVLENESIQLKQEDFEYLMELAIEIEANTEKLEKRIILDGWESIVYYNNTFYELNYTGAKLDIVPKLIDKLIENSSIQVRFDEWN